MDDNQIASGVNIAPNTICRVANDKHPENIGALVLTKVYDFERGLWECVVLHSFWAGGTFCARWRAPAGFEFDDFKPGDIVPATQAEIAAHILDISKMVDDIVAHGAEMEKVLQRRPGVFRLFGVMRLMAKAPWLRGKTQ